MFGLWTAIRHRGRRDADVLAARTAADRSRSDGRGESVLRGDAVPELRRSRLAPEPDREIAPRRLRGSAESCAPFQQYRTGSRMRYRTAEQLPRCLVPPRDWRRHVSELIAAGGAVPPRAPAVTCPVRADESVPSLLPSGAVRCRPLQRRAAPHWRPTRRFRAPCSTPQTRRLHRNRVVQPVRTALESAAGRAVCGIWRTGTVARSLLEEGTNKLRQKTRVVRRSVPSSARVYAYRRRSARVVRTNEARVRAWDSVHDRRARLRRATAGAGSRWDRVRPRPFTAQTGRHRQS